MWYTYILKSSKKNWHYVGSSNDLGRRLNEHNALKVASTKFYAPLELVYSKEWLTEKEARDYEKRIKRKRIEKESIIRKIENKGS
ncbi:MAG: excinuclease ABC subunit C [Parcubacteria group bacterium Gr01-1014_30]|nr:MAG: excinuclease ABC subunit C [Parcubacteria group bacterium Gr01-1014_30]